MKQSAGLLLYRFHSNCLQVFLVHPGGPFWARKDAGAWTIPKGEPMPGEELLAAARRELAEETGFRPDGTFIGLNPVRQKGGKLVHAWALAADVDPLLMQSNSFEIEWPPRSGKRQQFPEVDKAGWFTIEEARAKVLPAQLDLLTQLEELLAKH